MVLLFLFNLDFVLFILYSYQLVSNKLLINIHLIVQPYKSINLLCSFLLSDFLWLEVWKFSHHFHLRLMWLVLEVKKPNRLLEKVSANFRIMYYYAICRTFAFTIEWTSFGNKSIRLAGIFCISDVCLRRNRFSMSLKDNFRRKKLILLGFTSATKNETTGGVRRLEWGTKYRNVSCNYLVFFCWIFWIYSIWFRCTWID